MAMISTPQHCAYPGCDQAPAAPGSDRGAKPKYCGDPAHNPLAAHRERRKREGEKTGQRAEETGGQPVTLGLTRAAELVLTLEKLTAQHADTLTRAVAELRAAGDIESAEAEVYAARASAEQRVATAEARLAEEIQRRRDAEAERDAARADTEQANDAAAQAITRMDNMDRELTELRTATAEETRQVRANAVAEIQQVRDKAQHDVSTAGNHAARQVADADARAEQAEQDTTRARHAEAAAITRADHAQAAAADETSRIRADHQHALDQILTATNAHVTALEETRDALRIRAERAEADLDSARTDKQRLAEQLAQVTVSEASPDPAAIPASRPRTPSRTKKAAATRTPQPEA